VSVKLGGGDDTLNLATGLGVSVIFVQTAVFDGQGGTNTLSETTANVTGSPTFKNF
jgi:hypothetical protein